MIFAREVSDPLTSLVKKIDVETVKNSNKNMGSFVVFLNDDEALQDKLKALARDADLKECVLTIDNPAGPPAYGIAKDADVVVLLYDHHTVRVKHTFHKGELNDAAVDRVVADVGKIVGR